MSAIATMLHISDLHFVKQLDEPGRRGKHTLLAKSHSYDKLIAFNETLQEIQNRAGKYDIVLATGDLTTDGSKEAFNTALEFFESDEIRRSNPSRLIAYGLNAGSNRRLLLPGNHDRYGGRRFPLQRSSNSFETIFQSAASYPYSVGYRRSAAVSDPSQPTLIFFVFDSTPPPTAKFWAWDRIARGQVTKSECQWLDREASRLVQEKKVKGLDGEWIDFDPDNCIRLAVLHHHPVVDADKAQTFRYKLTYMENYEVFVDHCLRAGMNLVLFGHQHLQYNLKHSPSDSITKTPFGRPNEVYFLCCPSTLEYSEKRNGFYVMNFDSKRIDVELYEWNQTAFEFAESFPISL
jgi:DNA repair exonuclease SbcCD nuclease subunit